MSRTHLLGAASAVALAFVSSASFAQQATTIQGGGSTLAEFDYFKEFAAFNASGPTATFANADGDNANDTLYWPSGSGTGQSAFLTNNLSADCFKVLATGCGGGTVAPGGTNAVHYGASDATFSYVGATSQVSMWNSSSVGALAAGHLIQLPSMGVGISIPVVNSLVTKNGADIHHKPIAGGITLTDNDLCGIFSGKIYNWNQTSAAAKTTPGLITVVYRSDGSGTSFLLLNHLAAVCTSTNSNFPGATATTSGITPNVTFLTVFTNSTPPIPPGQTTTNFLGEKGSGGVANTLSNLNGITLTSAIGYLSPDFTTVDPNSDALLSNNQKSALVVAAVVNGTKPLPYVPYVADVTNALNHAKQGTTLRPPANAAAGALPQNYVPLIQTTTLGYPIVGFTTFDFAQCYHNTTGIGQSLLTYLGLHYSTNATYAGIINRNGFVAIAATQAKVFSPVIQGAILTNTKGWNDNIDNTTACSGLAGR